jgi:hypothetical protein
MLLYFTAIWYILWPFGNVVVIWYTFPSFGILCQEKSGNPGADRINQRQKKTANKHSFRDMAGKLELQLVTEISDFAAT